MYKHKNGITLRKVERHDLVDLLAYKNESWWGTHRVTIANSEDQTYWYENTKNNELYMILEHGGFSIGVGCYVNIDWISRSLDISGGVYKSHRNADLSKKVFEAGLDFAFEMLNMQRVQAEVLETHVVAQKLEINHLGFVKEGVRRKAVYKCGHYLDSIMLGMLREEWLLNPRVISYGESCNQNVNFKLFNKLMERQKASIERCQETTDSF
jgi:RimJ/RimL family protein N-acetyltransferase